MKLLAAKHYDPSTAATAATTAALAMTALDTTNLRLSVTVPSHGMVRVRMQCVAHGNTNSPQILLGVLEGSTVRGRVAPKLNASNNAATTMYVAEADFCLTGLTPGTYNWDAAYGVETGPASSALKWGGPNNTTTNDAFGAFVFEVYDPAPTGSADWTDDERTAIRAILGIPGSGTTPADPTTGILDTIRDAVGVVDGVVDAILVDTAEIGAAGAGLTALAQASGVNVTHFGGTAGTFSGGRPQVERMYLDGNPVIDFGGTLYSYTRGWYDGDLDRFGFVGLGNFSSNSTIQVGGTYSLRATAITETATGRLAGAFSTMFDVASPVLTAASVNQTGDAYARIGANGAGLTSLAPASTALTNATWTDTKAGYIDAAITSRLATASITLSGGAVTVGTNNDKTGYSISGTLTTLDGFNTSLNSAHGSGSWATATGFAVAGDIPTTAQIADKVLGRSIAGSADGGRTVGQALATLRNKVAFDVPSAGQFTVFADDDTTPLWTGTYTATSGASPVTAIDPT